jgi:hypothetical protein
LTFDAPHLCCGGLVADVERRGPPVVVQRRGDAVPDQEFFDPAATENGPVGSNDDPSFGSPKDHVERSDGLRLERRNLILELSAARGRGCEPENPAVNVEERALSSEPPRH